MFNSGFVESDLTGISTFNPLVTPVGQPRQYSIQNQIEKPHDQGNRGICVSVCVTDMCKYLYKGLNKPWVRSLDYFYNSRKDTSVDGMSPREAFDRALNDRCIKSFAFLRNVLAIKHCILANGPVMLCMPVYNSLRTNFWDYEVGDSLEGHHAVTVVGYNVEGFILRNSWGLSYGNKGYSVFPYTALGKVKEAWTVFS